MLLLCDALKELLLEALANLELPGKDGPAVPNVIVGWLPPRRAGEKEGEEFPFVRILPLEGFDQRTQGICTVSILVGAWANDADGWRDCVNVLQRIRLALTSTPGQTVAGRYRLEEEQNKLIEWRLYEDQPYPQWFGELTAHFSIPVMVPNLSREEARFYGEGQN
ncbi:hypothetical protein [Acetomicrobium sp. S15 = DSM 107314]|uniref:hypothetical protein n=1 Tax=Acetomicrobium sp. S15 = DSM 107314 TaxID=2529858 RepID=UPI0018E149F2|nr:hypothetical protein [Acetomicrobium sp. S15 = DSM 107314]